MYLHNNLDLVYIANPKTGSSAMCHALLKTGEWTQVKGHHEIDETLITEGTNVFSVVREPLDWHISWYFHYHSDLPFIKWLRWFLKTGNSCIKAGSFPGLKYSTHVLFYDRLEAGLQSLFTEFGLADLHLERKNEQGRNKRPVTDFFDSAATTLLCEERPDLFQLYGNLVKLRGTEPCLKMQSSN